MRGKQLVWQIEASWRMTVPDRIIFLHRDGTCPSLPSGEGLTAE